MRLGRRPRPIRAAALLAALVAGLSCGPDGSDVYTAPAPSASDPAADSDAATDVTGPDSSAGDTSNSDTGDSGSPAVSVRPNGKVVDVRALDNSFIVEEIEITAGTEVRWENRGRNDHDVVPVDDAQTWGVELDDFTPGDSYSHVFTTPGTYRYYCTIHGTTDIGMVGAVIVN